MSNSGVRLLVTVVWFIKPATTFRPALLVRYFLERWESLHTPFSSVKDERLAIEALIFTFHIVGAIVLPHEVVILGSELSLIPDENSSCTDQYDGR